MDKNSIKRKSDSQSKMVKIIKKVNPKSLLLNNEIVNLKQDDQNVSYIFKMCCD